MANESIKMEGVVQQLLPNAMFNVEIGPEGDRRVILGHLSGKMRMNFIRIMAGDTVSIEVSPYDLTKGRITYRHK